MLVNAAHKTPWYKQFWPWFVFGLPAITVVAGVLTVIIAVRHADTLVVDDYYKEGLAINQNLKALALAEELGLSFEINVDQTTKQISVQLNANENFEAPEFLQLTLIHPFNARQDLSFPLQKQQGLLYRQQFSELQASNWSVELKPLMPEIDNNGNWKLRGKF